MDFGKWMMLFLHGYLILAGPTRSQLEFFNPCGRGAVCEQLRAVFVEFRSLSVKNWICWSPLWVFGHMDILVHPDFSSVASGGLIKGGCVVITQLGLALLLQELSS